MPEEELEAQNTSEQTEEPAQPEGGEEQTPEAPEETPAPKEDKKQRDFEQGMHKWRERAKELETELSIFKTQPVKQVEPEGDQIEAIETLRQLIREEVAPVRSELESSKREAAIERIGKMPYTADFAEDIAEEAKTIPKEWAFEKRLELGRATIIARNLDRIVDTNKQAGLNEAYEHQAVKGNRPLGAAPEKPATDKSLLERFENQELSSKEMAENWAEINKLREEKFGI